jgi:pimeloyl-ACP methyl ester carboxylesterase
VTGLDPAPHLETHESGPVDGPLVVLVHGALDRGTGMAKLSRRLDRRARVLRFDRRGYGRSRPHPGPFTIAANTDDLVTLLAGRPAVLVGHSLGSHVVLRLAARHPALVRSVVVYEPPLSWEPWWPGSTGGSFALGEQDPGDAAETFMRHMAGDQTWERLPAATRAARRAEGRAFVDELRDLRLGPPWDPAAVTCPVVVGYGGRSREHHITGSQAVAARLQDARAVELEGCGHGAHLSDPDAFVNRLVLPVLDTVGPVGPVGPATV